MTVYAVSKTYVHGNKVKYQVLPYSLWGTIKVHFKLEKGLISLIPFLKTCRLTEKRAKKLQAKLAKEV